MCELNITFVNQNLQYFTKFTKIYIIQTRRSKLKSQNAECHLWAILVSMLVAKVLIILYFNI